MTATTSVIATTSFDILKLPVEIFQLVELYLTPQEITICQYVCRSWYLRWIASAYQSIYIKGKTQFYEFFNYTLKASLYPPETDFSVGYQLRKLVIENSCIQPSVLGQLPSLCPYLEVLMIDGVALSESAKKESFSYYQQRRNMEELSAIKDNFKYWKNMQHIVELNGITISHTLLNIQQQFSGIDSCSKLTRLTVQFSNPNDRMNSKLAFINSLRNAPLLKSLSLENIYLEVEELETIHGNCPDLSLLKFINIVLLPITGSSSTTLNIEPVQSLHTFQLKDSSLCDDVPGWLHYISEKYTNLKTLDIGRCSFLEAVVTESNVCGPLQTLYDDQLVHMAEKFSKLENLRLLPFSLSSRFFAMLDCKGVALQKLALGNGLNRPLKQSLDALFGSQQHHSITSLSLYGWSFTATDMNGPLLIMDTLFQCQNITNLELSMGRYTYYNDVKTGRNATHPAIDCATLYFDVILRQCPKLTSLAIKDAKLISTTALNSTFDKTTTSRSLKQRVSYVLEDLRLDNVFLDDTTVFEVVSKYCPQLSQLSLVAIFNISHNHDSSCFNIDLPAHNLKTLVLDRVRASRKCSVRLGTSRFKITTAAKSIWCDLMTYECATNLFSSKHDCSSPAIDTTFLSERMRAKTAKLIEIGKDREDRPQQYYNLEQSIHIAVSCKTIQSLLLTGLQII